MKWKKTTFICPSCFEESRLQDVRFRCDNDVQICEPEHDSVYTRFLNRGVDSGENSRVMAKVIRPKKPSFLEKINVFKIPKKAICHSCQHTSTTRACPKCHSELPYTIGDYKDLTFAIIGAKQTGKSHYIAVLIEVIKQTIARNFDSSLDELNEATTKRYEVDFYNSIFKKKEIIDATVSARADRNVRTPLIYSKKIRNKVWWKLGRKEITDVSTLVFFDTAGEDLNAEDVMRTENRYIYNSQGIILLIDPLQIQSVRDELRRLNPAVELPEINTETSDIIGRTANLIRKAKGIGQKKMIDIPIAVTFSKVDAIRDILSASSILRHEGNHEGYFNLNDFHGLNDEIAGLLEKWTGGGKLYQQVTLNFENFGFFGISSLGAPPKGTQIERIRPFRVEDPFLWLLHHHKLIKGKK
jgi:hypothetical protein